MKKKKKKKRKLKIGRIFLAFFLILLMAFIIFNILDIKIKNIYIQGNYYLKDQEIIDLAGISDYPSVLTSIKISDKLKNNVYIKDVKVSVKWFNQVYIEIVENRPLFYSEYMSKTVLLDGKAVDEKYSVPTVLNYVVDSVYNDFVKQFGTLDIDVINRISEIEYKPNNVDESRFLLTMTDGNFVYINNLTFYKMDKYLEIIKNFPDKKGILYLDYGNNFEIID